MNCVHSSNSAYDLVCTLSVYVLLECNMYKLVLIVDVGLVVECIHVFLVCILNLEIRSLALACVCTYVLRDVSTSCM